MGAAGGIPASPPRHVTLRAAKSPVVMHRASCLHCGGVVVVCELFLLLSSSSAVNCRHCCCCCCCLWLSWVPLLRSSPGIPLLGLSVLGTTDSGCGCFIPPPSRPTWFVRQAVPIDVTRLGFIHKIFCNPSPLWSNQLAAVLELLLNEQKLVNEFAIYGSISQGRTLWAPPVQESNISPCLRLWLSLLGLSFL